MPLTPPLHAHAVPDRGAPPLSRRQRRLQRPDPRRGPGLQGHCPRRGLRRTRRHAGQPRRRRGRHQVNVQGEDAEKARRHQQRVLHPHDRMGRPPGGHGVRRNGRRLPDPGRASARQIPAGVRPARRLQQHRRERVGGQHLLASCARRRTWSTAAATWSRPTSSSPAPQQVAAGYALYGPTTMLVLTRGQRRRRLHAGPEPGRVHAHAPEPADARETRRSSPSTRRTAASGSRRSSATWTNAWPARPGRAARTSTCAGSPAWWPRRTAS